MKHSLFVWTSRSDRTAVSRSTSITLQCPTQNMRYLGMHLGEKLSWKYYLQQRRRDAINNWFRKNYWVFQPKAPNNKTLLRNKNLLDEALLNAIWTYGASMWVCTVLYRVWTKIWRKMTGAPWWYYRKQQLPVEVSANQVLKVMEKLITRYKKKLHDRSNVASLQLLAPSSVTRLQRKEPTDVPVQPNRNRRV